MMLKPQLHSSFFITSRLKNAIIIILIGGRGEFDLKMSQQRDLRESSPCELSGDWNPEKPKGE